MILIGISGICGKMGQRILRLAQGSGEFQIGVALERSGHPRLGEEIEGVKVVSAFNAAAQCDCLIEFASPSAALAHLPVLAQGKKAAVIGTTGFSSEEIKEIEKAAKEIPIVYAPNMSIGVNLLFRLIKDAAKTLQGYDIIVEEAHHVHKKDSPSGTAKKIVQILNSEGFSIEDADVIAIRENEIVGDHSVVFKNAAEELEISHSAKTRNIFAQGALRAAAWVIGKKPGFYSMQDVLNEEERRERQ